MFLIYHCPCHLEYMLVLSFIYFVLLRCVSTRELPLNSFLSKVCCEGITEILLVAVRLKASNMPTSCLFDFVFEFLEVRELFTVLPHCEYVDVPGEVVDEGHIVPTTTKCCRLGWSHTFECITSRIPLLMFLCFKNG